MIDVFRILGSKQSLHIIFNTNLDNKQKFYLPNNHKNSQINHFIGGWLCKQPF